VPTEPDDAVLEDHEESYFVSMTDLMVGMLFVFVIMLMAFALDYRQAEVSKEETVQELKSAEDARAEMLRDLKRLLQESGVRVEIDERHGILRLPEAILFAKGDATLTAQGREALARVGWALTEVLPCFARVNNVDISGLFKDRCPQKPGARLEAIFVEGHTDSDPYAPGAGRTNWELSVERAITTYRSLAPAQSLLAGLQNDTGQALLSVAGYGEQRPIAQNDSEDKKRRNRRIDLRFIMATPKPEQVDDIEREVKKRVSGGAAGDR
jgi:flagellar motor protein MotB